MVDTHLLLYHLKVAFVLPSGQFFVDESVEKFVL